MIFSILILGAPDSTASVNTAYRFVTASLDAGHSIYRVFFYHDAVNTGNGFIAPPQDENNLPEQWQAMAEAHGMDMVVCVASALRRGVIDTNEARRYEKSGANLKESFDISGLGQLVDASIHSDRLITFGP